MTDTKMFTDGATAATGDPETQNETQRTNSVLRNTIAFGFDVQNFLREGVGKYLTNKANTEIADLRDELERAESEDAVENRRIRLEIAVRRVWQDWLARAIQEGEAAQEIAIERGQL